MDNPSRSDCNISFIPTNSFVSSQPPSTLNITTSSCCFEIVLIVSLSNSISAEIYNHLLQAECQMEEMIRLLEECENAINSLPSSYYHLFLSHLRQMEFCVYQMNDQFLSRRKMMELHCCHAEESLYETTHNSQVYYIYNVCIGLLRRKDILRCCVLWCQYWKIDIVLVNDSSWYSTRMKENQDFLDHCNSLSRQLIILDSFVMEYWKRKLSSDGLLEQVLQMEVNSLM